MSTLTENVAKVTAAHAALKTAIAAKGVAVPENAKLTDMPALVGQIETTPVPTNPRAVFTYDDATSIVVPNTLVVDMMSATNLKYFFYNCSRLASLTLPAGFGKSATDLSDCFNGCSSLASVELPAGFGQSAKNTSNFVRGCRVLKHLTFPTGFCKETTNLGACFLDCVSLTTLTLPDGFGQAATNLNHCFRFCRSLTTLTLPDGFGQNSTSNINCFYNCTGLTTLTLPDGFGQNSTSNINCFYDCKKLTDITGNPNFKVSLDLSPCTKLTHDSLMVVINGLQTVTKTQTLTLGSTNLAKLTDEEKKAATDKGWTLA